MKKKKNKKNSKYWKDRTIESEELAQRTANIYSNKQKELYRKAYKEIEKEFNALYADIRTGEELSRSQLYRYHRYSTLMKVIQKECGIIASAQMVLIDAALNKVFEDTLGFAANTLDVDNSILKHQVNAFIDTTWSGTKFSNRIWTNVNALASELKEHVEQELILGKNPSVIKKTIQDKFDVNFRVADRLVRTEAAFVHNKACIESYKMAGVTQVKYLAEKDCCDICKDHKDKSFDIGTEPLIPQHPNCRCCYIPVVQSHLQGLGL